VHCDACGAETEIAGVQSFRCPKCGELTADLRQGRELEIESIELEEPDPASPDPVEERV
jgi:Zn finger protein HypA/HybF involved in hydrogenase expression